MESTIMAYIGFRVLGSRIYGLGFRVLGIGFGFRVVFFEV